uniref:Uncharacterized protein n=1 Tax=Rhizophora mucronata TaxID=61149 RepID=A0A2P2MYV8_RHIMU
MQWPLDTCVPQIICLFYWH